MKRKQHEATLEKVQHEKSGKENMQKKRKKKKKSAQE